MLKLADTILIFGGAGLVGIQIARKIAAEFAPRKIIIASRYEREAQEAVELLQRDFPQVREFRAVGGDIFLRSDYVKIKTEAGQERETEKTDIMQNAAWLDQTFQDIFGQLREDEPDNIRTQSFLVKLIEEETPDVIVDSINTATAISYQDTKWISHTVKDFKDRLERLVTNESQAESPAAKQSAQAKLEALAELCQAEPRPGISNLRFLDILLVSQALPQLINHIRLLFEAMKKAKTRIYLKVGTTGTGGMGMNIPYTHGEDKPSFDLLSKNAVAFAQTGLLFLLARTPNAPVVKEIKPGAMIGYKRVEAETVKRRRKGQVVPVPLYTSRIELLKIGRDLQLEEQEQGYQKQRDSFSIIGINTGENGFSGLGEFETITALGQMEFVTAEEVADYVIHELKGKSTGKDVITAVDSAIVDPSYRGGYLRETAIRRIMDLEQEARRNGGEILPSVATGVIGPPKLTKLLYEAYLIKQNFPTLKEIVAGEAGALSAEDLSEIITDYVKGSEVTDLITSLGIPIIMADGETLLRGPFISIPELPVPQITIQDFAALDEWAEQGWVDLRPINFTDGPIENFGRDGWIGRFRKMLNSKQRVQQEGSAKYDRTTYIYDDIRIGEVVAWIFNNELIGHRAW